MGLFDKFVDLLNSWESPKTESQIEAAKEYMSQVEWEEHAKANRSSRPRISKRDSPLRWLPSAFYVIAILGFAGFVILAIQSENSYLFGYGVGSAIACLGSGRVIELLQDINDELYRKRMSESP